MPHAPTYIAEKFGIAKLVYKISSHFKTCVELAVNLVCKFLVVVVHGMNVMLNQVVWDKMPLIAYYAKCACDWILCHVGNL